MKVSQKSTIGFILAGIVALTVWFMPTPAGLTVMGQKSLAIFLATLVLFIAQPVSVGLCMIGVLTIAAFVGITTPRESTSSLVFFGFSSTTFWLITTAFVLGIAITRSGLGQRIAYKLMSKFGKTSLKTGYALTFTNYIVAPATPSIIGRGAGMALPIARSVCTVHGWKPKHSRYIMLISAMATHTSGGAFMTGATSGPIVAALATGILGIEISWTLWLIAALPATLTLLLLQPWIIYKLYPPESELKTVPNHEKIARRKLAEMGPISTREKIVLVTFAVVMGLWATQLIHGINPSLVGLLGVAILMFTATVGFEDLAGLNFNILIALGCFISIIAMAGGNGVFDWLAASVSGWLGHLSPPVFLVAVAVLLCYFHILFAAVSMMALVFAPVIFTVTLGTKVPFMAVGLLSGIIIGLCAHFAVAHGVNVAYQATGAYGTGELLRVGLVLSTIGMLLVILSIPLWSLLGLL